MTDNLAYIAFTEHQSNCDALGGSDYIVSHHEINKSVFSIHECRICGEEFKFNLDLTDDDGDDD